jgi:tRNA G46 methylase TrmB
MKQLFLEVKSNIVDQFLNEFNELTSENIKIINKDTIIEQFVPKSLYLIHILNNK